LPWKAGEEESGPAVKAASDLLECRRRMLCKRHSNRVSKLLKVDWPARVPSYALESALLGI
jgi:hypothetical protein